MLEASNQNDTGQGPFTMAPEAILSYMAAANAWIQEIKDKLHDRVPFWLRSQAQELSRQQASLARCEQSHIVIVTLPNCCKNSIVWRKQSKTQVVEQTAERCGWCLLYIGGKPTAATASTGALRLICAQDFLPLCNNSHHVTTTVTRGK